MPFKAFQVNEILTASDVNTYLAEQSVLTFAGTAARASAVGTPVVGMVSYLEDSDQLEVYGGTAVGWSSASNFMFGTAVPSDGQVVAYSTAVSAYISANASELSFGTAVPSDGQVLTYSAAVSGYVPQASSGGAVRNLIYNGAMQVAQRGTSETGITGAFSAYYTADRWKFLGSVGTWSQTVEADGPTGSGFTKSWKVECTTADAAPGAGDALRVQHALEGQDLQGLKKGTSDAESLTLSFWVKSNVTGTHIAELTDTDNSRQISASYTVNASGVWEKKTITFAGDTTGAFDNDNASSLSLFFWLVAGSNFSSGTLNTSWASTTNADRAVGQTNLAAATSNYWQVTGVQLETGTVASPFEHKPYGVELAECQRYYWQLNSADAAAKTFFFGQVGSSTVAAIWIRYPVQMRVAATVSSPDVTDLAISTATFSDPAVTALSVVAGRSGNYGTLANFTVASGLSAGNACFLLADNNTNAILEIDAEL